MNRTLIFTKLIPSNSFQGRGKVKFVDKGRYIDFILRI